MGTSQDIQYNKFMKRLLVCICAGIGLMASQQLSAQHSIPSPNARAIHLNSVRSVAENYIGLQDLQRPQLQLSSEQNAYLQTLATYLDNKRKLTNERDTYLSSLSPSLDKHRAELLLAIAYYNEGQNDNALAILNSLSLASLYEYERDQALLLRAYLLLSRSKRTDSDLHQARTVLGQVAKHSTLLGDQAALYLSNILWYEGKAKEAHDMLERRSWSDSILPEVAYQDALISYSLDTPNVALANSTALLSRYPEMQSRTRLLGAMAYAYYELGDYKSALSTLKASNDREALLPQEYYILGASLYAEKAYDTALIPLQRASLGEGELKALSQFALGNIYQEQGDIYKAQLAFESVINTTQDAKLKEQALYRFIEISHSGGQDVFGNHAKLAEDFLRSYPTSSYRTRVLELMRAYIAGSSNHSASLNLINSLEKQGIKLQDLKQEVFLRHALALKAQQSDYLPALASAIQLGYTSNTTFARALGLRAEALIQHKRYKQAEDDTNKALEYSKGLSKEEIAEIEYLRAYALYNQKKYDKALSPFTQASLQLQDKYKQGDALLRLGDSFLAVNRYDDALKSYQQAHSLIPNGSDEALYRQTKIYGKQRQYSKQIQTIQQTLQEYPKSNYTPYLMYDKGRAERLSNKTSEALNTFGAIVTQFPISDVAPTAKLEQALIYSNLEQDIEAIKTYKELIALYPHTREAESALGDLRTLYLEQGKSDEFLSYAQTLEGKLKPSSQDEAHLKFLSIEDKARRGLSGTTEALEQYLATYPNSSDRVEAQKLLSTRYVAEGRSLEAIAMLKTAYQESQIGESKLQLGLQLADLQQQSNQSAEAYSTYRSLYKDAQGTKLYRTRAALGVLRTAINSNKSNEALPIAEETLTQTGLTTLEREEVTLLKGRLEESNKSFNQAVNTYATLSNSYNSKYGAEAIVRRADILMRLRKFGECQAVLDKFIASGSSQTYWLARAFVLLSDNYEKQGELYLAKQYIESLRDNYNGNEADIKEMISLRLNKYNN